MGRFQELTAKYTGRGMGRAAAEAKARDIMFGDGEETEEEEDKGGLRRRIEDED